MSGRSLKIAATLVLAFCILATNVMPAFAAVIANQKIKKSGTSTWVDGPIYVGPGGPTVDFSCSGGGGSGYGYSFGWKSCINAFTTTHKSHTVYTQTWYKNTSSSAYYIGGIPYYSLGTHTAQVSVINAWGSAYNRDNIITR